MGTRRVSAVAVGNAWQVAPGISADKVSADTQGRETPRPIEELIEIGVYGPGTDEEPPATLHLAKHELRSGPQRITVTVSQRPGSASIDPRNVLIDTLQRDEVMGFPRLP